MKAVKAAVVKDPEDFFFGPKSANFSFYLSFCHPQTDIFRSILEKGDSLKCAYITPVFKGEIKCLPISYHLVKTLERIIQTSWGRAGPSSAQAWLKL